MSQHMEIHNTIAKRGGKWMGWIREWMQRTFRNGSDVTWGTTDKLEGGFVPTVERFEALAADVAAAALTERFTTEEQDALRHIIAIMQYSKEPDTHAAAATLRIVIGPYGTLTHEQACAIQAARWTMDAAHGN